MIDSVTLNISNFVTYSTAFFTKEEHKTLKGEYGVFGGYTTRYTTYPQQCKTEGRYFPQVHIIERYRRGKVGMVPVKRILAVQVSLPKLIFGASIFDFDERLLPIAAQKLADALGEIKVGVKPEDILEAVVSRVDYSKILKISASYGKTSRMLRALAPYEMKQSSDFNRRDYHDGRDGFYLKFYNSSRGFVIYDKFDEIVANGKTKLEQEIAREYDAGTWTKGALRIELSLQKKQTVEAALRRLLKGTTRKKDFTLRDAASADVAKTLLMETFDAVYVSGFNRLVRLADLKDTELVRLVGEHAADFRDRAVLYYLAHRVRNHGLKQAVEELKREASPATVGRYKRAVEMILSKAEAKKNVVDVIPYLRRKLVAFQPVLPKKLKGLLGIACGGSSV
jgi:hypothetical protein